ncbi:universal stress protein [Anthocerotibacter panamensis]|uniref:universal stress protein n=1 Tax=Anthocerotibacter panamensis TaxID=2857077 RepID=UPI001C401B06|nr:universal stress protein [Anthocerotibacter panamensis]
MFHKILVALDQSATGQQVFESALSLVKLTGGQLLLLHVLSAEEEGSPHLPVFSTLNAYPVPDTLEAYKEQWTAFENHGLKLLTAYTDRARSLGAKAEYTQSMGSPGRRICETATTWGADLIFMGRRGRSGLQEFFLGSVSNYVLHHAPCSVLVTHDALFTGGAERILVGLDHSTSSAQVFATALELAGLTQAPLLLTHVLCGEEEESPAMPVAPLMEYYPASPELLERYEQAWKDYEEQGWTLLRTHLAEATDRGVVAEMVQELGSPGPTLCALARERDCRLMVLGHRGRSGFQELFLGSVSNYALHHAPCSALVVQSSAPTNPPPAVQQATERLHP